MRSSAPLAGYVQSSVNCEHGVRDVKAIKYAKVLDVPNLSRLTFSSKQLQVRVAVAVLADVAVHGGKFTLCASLQRP
jgi:hypothetical protein